MHVNHKLIRNWKRKYDNMQSNIPNLIRNSIKWEIELKMKKDGKRKP